MEHIPSPPPVMSPRSYDEGEIASLITQIYNLMIALCYLSADDVVFPPAETGRHQLNTAVLEEVAVAQPVVSLLERLPYLRPGVSADFGDPVQFYTDSAAIDYLQDEDWVRWSRDPHDMHRIMRYGEHEPDVERFMRNTEEHLPDREYVLRPQDVALTRAISRDGSTWILDTEANTIRTLSGGDPLDLEWTRSQYPNYFPVVPENCYHYRNWPAIHAPTVLNDYIQSIRSLDVMLVNVQGEHNLAWGEQSSDSVNHVIKQYLLNEYGWPDDFRAEAWRADYGRLIEEAVAQEDEALSDLELRGQLAFVAGPDTLRAFNST